MNARDRAKGNSRSRRNSNAWSLMYHLCGKVKKKPTLKHRPAIWENMLGTVYAMNDKGKVEYFDYDMDKAMAYAGITADSTDVRVFRNKENRDSFDQRPQPSIGQWVWYVLRKP